MATESVWTPIIGWLFLIANSGRLLAYLPQIVAAARCDAGAKSVSILTWGYFAFAHLTALLYALFVLHDAKSVWIFSGNFVVTVILVGIVYWKRKRHRPNGIPKQANRDGTVLDRRRAGQPVPAAPARARVGSG
jgi:hypothetical protein